MTSAGLGWGVLGTSMASGRSGVFCRSCLGFGDGVWGAGQALEECWFAGRVLPGFLDTSLASGETGGFFWVCGSGYRDR